MFSRSKCRSSSRIYCTFPHVFAILVLVYQGSLPTYRKKHTVVGCCYRQHYIAQAIVGTAEQHADVAPEITSIGLSQPQYVHCLDL